MSNVKRRMFKQKRYHRVIDIGGAH